MSLFIRPVDAVFHVADDQATTYLNWIHHIDNWIKHKEFTLFIYQYVTMVKVTNGDTQADMYIFVSTSVNELKLSHVSADFIYRCTSYSPDSLLTNH